MKNKKLIIFLVILFASLFLYLNLDTHAVEENEDTLTPNAAASILIEKNTGEILYEKNAHEKRSPASMTKIMSIYLILEALENGVIKWDDIVTVSEHAASYGGSQVWLETGEQMSVEDLFKCMVIASANDATVALAEEVAGSEELFVQKMNERAQKLGLENTQFKDPTGLTDFDEGHYSSPYDMAMISRALLLEYEETTIKYSSMYEDYIREDTNNKFWLVNTNKLVKHVPGIDGLKTGWTSESGYNLTATKKEGNMRLISVLMGCNTASKRNFDTVKLLKYGFAQYELVEYKSKNYQVSTYENIMLSPQKVKIVTNEPVFFVVKKGETLENCSERFNFTIEKETIKAGEQIGELEIIKNGRVVYTVPLTVSEDCTKASYLQIVGRLMKEVFFG